MACRFLARSQYPWATLIIIPGIVFAFVAFTWYVSSASNKEQDGRDTSYTQHDSSENPAQMSTVIDVEPSDTSLQTIDGGLDQELPQSMTEDIKESV